MKSRTPPLILLAASLLLACNGEKSLPIHELLGNSMGTTYRIAIISPLPDLALDELGSRLQDRLDQIENVASTYRDSSDVGKFNRDSSTDWIPVSSELCAMVSSAAAIGRQTNGAFDITIGGIVNLWGFGPDAGRNEPPDDVDIEIAMSSAGLQNLEIDCDQSQLRKSDGRMKIDLSGWAKGYAVDQLAELLDASGLENYLVEIGGELKVRGHNAHGRAFAIAIENPSAKLTDDYTIISISNTGVATSGDYRNFFEYEGTRYAHTLNPATGRPVLHSLSAVTVIHPSTATADAFATALLVLGPNDGFRFANANGVAALFAVSTTSGLEYLTTAAFDAGGFLDR